MHMTNSDHINWELYLLDLPNDVIVLVFEFLTVDSLAKLSQTCSRLKRLSDEHGWATYLRLNPRRSWSLTCMDSVWTPYERVRYDKRTERAWSERRFLARPLSSSWQGKFLPVIAISEYRLVYAVGSTLHLYSFSSSATGSDNAPGLRSEGTYLINKPKKTDEAEALHDVTSLAFKSDNGTSDTLIAGFADGAVMKIILGNNRPNQGSHINCIDTNGRHLSPELLYSHEEVVESLSVASDFSLTLSGAGEATLRTFSTDATSSLRLNEARGWSTHLSLSSSPYAAFGTSSTTPLTIHSITESSLVDRPSHILSSEKLQEPYVPPPGASASTATLLLAARRRVTSAVYGICKSPPSFSSLPGQVLVSGWFDGLVRIYDLRSSRRLPSTGVAGTNGSTVSVSTLLPVMTMYDRWSTEPIYTVAAGGAEGYTIAAGSARHSVVAFWDVRQPRQGWSVHAPGNDPSPVYSIVLESSRLFGATQSRPFVYDFGPGVSEETYPPVAASRSRVDGSLKQSSEGYGYSVTTYLHSS